MASPPSAARSRSEEPLRAVRGFQDRAPVRKTDARLARLKKLPCTSPGEPCPIDTSTDVVIDPITATAPVTRVVSARTRIRVVIRDVNPFLYNYQIQVNSTPVQDKAALSFAKTALGIGVGSSTGAPPTRAQQAAPQLTSDSTNKTNNKNFLANVAAQACSTRANALIHAVTEARTKLDSVHQHAARWQRVRTEYNRRRAQLYDPRIRASVLDTVASHLAESLAAMAKTADPDSEPARVRDTRLSASQALDAAASARAARPTNCSDATKEQVQAQLDSLAHLQARYVLDTVELAAYLQFEPNAGILADQILSIVHDTTSYYLVQPVGGYVSPAVDTVQVFRTPATDSLPAYTLSTASPRTDAVAHTANDSVHAGTAQLMSGRQTPRQRGMPAGGTSSSRSRGSNSPSVYSSNTTSPDTTNAGDSGAAKQGGTKANSSNPHAPAPLTIAEVDFGRARLGLSIGAAAAVGIRSATYRVARRSVPNPSSPGDTAESYIAQADSSTVRAVPMLFLHARVLDLYDSSFPIGLHVTLGATIHQVASSTGLEYLAGGSLSAFDEKAFFTVGDYIGPVSELDPGTNVGDRVPNGTKGTELPVRSRTQHHLGFGLSFYIPVGSM